MSGYVSAIGLALPIVIYENKYNIGWTEFSWGLDHALLTERTKQVLDIFDELERAVNRQVRQNRNSNVPLEWSLTLDKDFCHKRGRIMINENGWQKIKKIIGWVDIKIYSEYQKRNR